MINRHATITVSTEARQQFFDVTDRIRELVAELELSQGIVTVYSAHTSCCVLIQEESEDVTYWQTQYVLQDTLTALGKIIPPMSHEGQYLHPGPIHVRNAVELRQEKPEWSLNTDGHIISSILGRSQVVPVEDSELVLGTFGRIYFGDLDSVRGRERTVRVHALGE